MQKLAPDQNLLVAALAGVEPRRTAARLRVGAGLLDRTKTPVQTAVLKVASSRWTGG